MLTTGKKKYCIKKKSEQDNSVKKRDDRQLLPY